MKKQYPNQISIKQEKLHQCLTAGLESLLFFLEFVAIALHLQLSPSKADILVSRVSLPSELLLLAYL